MIFRENRLPEKKVSDLFALRQFDPMGYKFNVNHYYFSYMFSVFGALVCILQISKTKKKLFAECGGFSWQPLFF